MEGTISALLDYRRYAGEVTLMFVDAPDEVSESLSDLRDALAGAGARIEKDGNELAALQNSLICMHDALKAYKEHGFKVPARLTQIHKQLEQRRDELVPQGPQL